METSLAYSHPVTRGYSAKIRAVLAQLEPVPGNIDRNFEKVLSVVESHEGDLYVFPEMFLVGYTSQDIIYAG